MGPLLFQRREAFHSARPVQPGLVKIALGGIAGGSDAVGAARLFIHADQANDIETARHLLVDCANLLLDGAIQRGWMEALATRDFSLAWRAILALTISYSAFIAEVLRAGFQSVPRGQIEAAKAWISGIVEEAEVGKVYNGKVVNIVDFGAFVEIAPGKDGLCHISELAEGFVKSVGDICKVGDRLEFPLALPYAGVERFDLVARQRERRVAPASARRRVARHPSTRRLVSGSNRCGSPSRRHWYSPPISSARWAGAMPDAG